MHRNIRFFCLLLMLCLFSGCASYQPTKNVWKTTKGLWNTYVSPPASIDYEDKGAITERAQELTRNMMNVDRELVRLERLMQNADRPPTQQWLNNLFVNFPWISGVAGVRYDGVIIGQEPPDSLKDLDFNHLLYEDQKQSSRALRTDVEPGPLGPEIMLAAPLYDGIDFLGVVVTYFDLRNLMDQVGQPRDMVVLCPTALLWPGRFEFAATPLAGVDWEKAVRESTSGTCTNENGTFLYLVRYLGNLPLVFAVPETGEFPEGDGDVSQGAAFFPQEREKIAPPPVPERAPRNEDQVSNFGVDEDEEYYQAGSEQGAQPAGQTAGSDLQPGSQDSMLLRPGQQPAQSNVQERQLEGENVPVQRVQRPRIPAGALDPLIQEVLQEPEPAPELEPMQRPSPFGPREDASEQAAEPQQTAPSHAPRRLSPFGPAEDEALEPSVTPANEGSGDTERRAAPFGPAEPEEDTAAPPAPAESQDDTEPSNRSGWLAPFLPREDTDPVTVEEEITASEVVEVPVQAPQAGEQTGSGQAESPAPEDTGDAPARTDEATGNQRFGRPSPFGPR